MSSFNLSYFDQKLVSKLRQPLAEPLSYLLAGGWGTSPGTPAALLGFMTFLGFSLETYFHCHDRQKVLVAWEFTELSIGFLMGP